MHSFKKRFIRLLEMADNPIPGDHVKVRESAKHKEWRGKIGIVKEVWIFGVEVDGEVRGLTRNSLEIIDDD